MKKTMEMKMWVEEKNWLEILVSVGLRRAHRRIIRTRELLEARVNESGITAPDTKREIIIFTIFPLK